MGRLPSIWPRATHYDYDFEDMYCQDNGRPCLPPSAMFNQMMSPNEAQVLAPDQPGLNIPGAQLYPMTKSQI